ncbi:trace amine-associated receptor 8b-like [Periophthalmus magnuspinnatus]|uniref:trace amine-associated receptor 8b-like n=1 Tax=Periophthalmus magnuspinnatus TaxID=409849 RepID=UPI00145ABE37|nr:trace amine-associated receptor 8b-like [Periophthalmus magnuspinnatus]
MVYGGHQKIYQKRSTLFPYQRMETDETELCFPHLHNSSCRKSKIDPTDNLITNVLLGFASMLTSILNLLVIIAITHFKKLHTAPNLILLSLAVSDFLVGLVVIPVDGIKWKICWSLSDLMCVMYYILVSAIFFSSVGNIILLSVDRYVAICQPLHYQNRMTGKVINISICTPLILITISIIYLNSCLNPLMYTFLFAWFRKAIKLIVTLQILKPGSSDAIFS